jgi:hypothetical protein
LSHPVGDLVSPLVDVHTLGVAMNEENLEVGVEAEYAIETRGHGASGRIVHPLELWGHYI